MCNPLCSMYVIYCVVCYIYVWPYMEQMVCLWPASPPATTVTVCHLPSVAGPTVDWRRWLWSQFLLGTRVQRPFSALDLKPAEKDNFILIIFQLLKDKQKFQQAKSMRIYNMCVLVLGIRGKKKDVGENKRIFLD